MAVAQTRTVEPKKDWTGRTTSRNKTHTLSALFADARTRSTETLILFVEFGGGGENYEKGSAKKLSLFNKVDKTTLRF